MLKTLFTFYKNTIGIQLTMKDTKVNQIRQMYHFRVLYPLLL